MVFINFVSRDKIKEVVGLLADSMEASLKAIYTEKKPNLIIIMVDSKASEKFFCNYRGSTNNPQGGTIIRDKNTQSEG